MKLQYHVDFAISIEEKNHDHTRSLSNLIFLSLNLGKQDIDISHAKMNCFSMPQNRSAKLTFQGLPGFIWIYNRNQFAHGSTLDWPGGDSYVSDAREDSYHEMKEC